MAERHLHPSPVAASLTLLGILQAATSSWFCRVFENIFDRQIKKSRDLERERQARVELAFFNRINGLSGNVQFRSKLSLRPVSFSTKYFESILQRYFR